MTQLAATVSDKLYGHNVWSNYAPHRPKQNIIQGWHGRFAGFEQYLRTAPVPIFADVGVWKGQSSIFVANLMKQLGLDGVVISIDTFLGSSEHWNMSHFTRNTGMPDLYQTFLENVFYHDATDVIVPLPETSSIAAKVLRSKKISLGIAHIDAGHSYSEVMADIASYWPLVEKGGYLIGDDYTGSWPGVVKAANEFAATNKLQLTVIGPKWIVQK